MSAFRYRPGEPYAKRLQNAERNGEVAAQVHWPDLPPVDICPYRRPDFISRWNAGFARVWRFLSENRAA